MNEHEINDIRTESDFKGITFSKYKKPDVRKELLNCLKNGKIEEACYWTAEFVCAGHYQELWDIVLTCFGKHIHLANPKLCLYLELRYEAFKEIVANGYIGNELRMRNNPRIRSLFAEIACVLCNSKKKYSLEGIKVKKTDFDSTAMTNKLKAPNVSYVSPVFLPGDPKELFIAINEFAFHISKDSKNSLLASYWLEWVMEFEHICRMKKQKCVCERRSTMPVDPKFQMDPIWIIWELVLGQARNFTPLMPKLMQSILKLYCLRYTDSVKKKRRYLIYFAICLLTEPFVMSQEMVSNKETVENVVKKIDTVYKQVKKNEIAPKTDYLMGSSSGGGGTKSDLDKTIEKMDKLNSMNTIIRLA
uniref:Uncharacterized protein n=1 Tax=viral metagenome TaxID=1070528 RepID=A0A6C0I653_9ZZZZ